MPFGVGAVDGLADGSVGGGRLVLGAAAGLALGEDAFDAGLLAVVTGVGTGEDPHAETVTTRTATPSCAAKANGVDGLWVFTGDLGELGDPGSFPDGREIIPVVSYLVPDKPGL